MINLESFEEIKGKGIVADSSLYNNYYEQSITTK
jgi:hypothetical protein